jgi:hypothetical protein
MTIEKGDIVDNQKLFSFIRRTLGALGLSPEAVDGIIEHISDFLLCDPKILCPL